LKDCVIGEATRLDESYNASLVEARLGQQRKISLLGSDQRCERVDVVSARGKSGEML
jgi:hypothetical protein